MKNRFVWLLLLLPVQLFAQATRPVEFFIKPHTANTVTVERDSIDSKYIAKFVGAYKEEHAALDSIFNAAATALDTWNGS